MDVDPAAAAYYRALPGNLGDRLRQVLKDTESGTSMVIEDGRCPMWRQDGLCRIQAELGHDALCKTCREFPRLRHDYGNFAQLQLELSCPEAARLIFSSPICEYVEEESPDTEDAEYDGEVMDILLRSRDTALAFLKEAAYPLPQTLAILLLYAHGVQNELDGGDAAIFDADICLGIAQEHAENGDIRALMDFYADLEILTPRWATLLKNKPAAAPWTEAYRKLAAYFIERYWLQAISDFDLVCRVKFLVTACLLIRALGGDPAQTAQLFSKEIENDPDNVDAILDGAYASPALTDVNLISLLLGR